MGIKNKWIIGLVFVLFSMPTQAQSVFGKWKTIDDRTGNPKAIINIYKEDGMMHGLVEEILEPGKEDAVCHKCEGEKKNQPVLGMKIIEDLEHSGEGVWKGKYLFDPEQAMTFKCKIWLNPNNPNELKVRGYLAFIFRTQTWIRAEG
ncbi:hypothetical protein KCTC52924_00037 [Arenibacter antarcticus]|uniref:DUF2147 domain-containing protein n=1 Tax=Arenibacter antarcticus TaxID=2040469 RepID=A0ABW5VJY9_9FLAO|nr:DUF2147 domain-containing protein [Arenibacter sp. H213]MCM4169193.1 DUF2147 domain-containing protein [Arenibacter sp. H213]